MGHFGLGRLVISANFQSECRFGQSLKVIMNAFLYVYGWTDGQVLNFFEKQAKMKKVNKQCLLDTPRTVRVSEKTWQVKVRTRRP